MAFLSLETVLPVIVKALNGPGWLISFIPSMATFGYLLPTILVTHWVEQMRAMRSYVLWVGLLQRIPYLFAGLALLFLGDAWPLTTLAIVVAAPLVSGFMGGAVVSAFYELVARIIPERRRASAFAIRFFMGGLIGVPAGFAVKWVLEKYPGTFGYGVLHMITFAFLALSFVTFSLVREDASTHPPPPRRGTLGLYFRSLPGLLRESADLRRFLWARCAGSGFLVLLPFLGIHSMTVTHSTESLVGYLLSAQMVGALVGNVVAGWMGDRSGGKIPLFLANALLLLMGVAAIFTTTVWGFYAVFFLFGFAFNASQVASSALITELAPQDRRAAFVGIVSFVTLPSLLFVSGLSAVIREVFGATILPASLASAVLMGVSLYFLAGIREPRRGSDRP